MNQTKTDICPQCGKPKQTGLHGNSCPHCLMALAMNNGFESPTTAPNSELLDEVHAPSIEQLVSTFPGLEIQHLIGHGGMGAVYQARQINLDRTVALKILSPRLSRDPAFAERFLREARTLAKLSHPNIVTVYDFGQAGDFYFLTMEFVDGVNLRDTISAKLLAPAEALAIVPQICEALQYAHDNGVVHRDIKPENILIAKNGSLKIADFGLAKLLQPTQEQVSLTATRQVLGTRNYMAPEQIESPDVVDHRADLYSLGVVFYELLTGELPLGRFSLPSEKSTRVPNRLDDVVMRTLEKDPNRRYQQASQIKTACESIEPKKSESPQPEATQEPDAAPLCQPFPITIEEMYAGLASGYGLMRGYTTHLELEYEVRDSVVDHNWGTAKVQIPLERITSIHLHRGLIYTRIDVQTDRFDVVSEIPNSKQGAFRVYLKKKDLGPAEQLVWRVNQILGNANTSIGGIPPIAAMPPLPPVKHKHVDSRFPGQNNSSGLLGGVLILLFLGFCVFVALAVIAGSLWMSYTQSTVESQATQTIEVKAQSAAGTTVDAESIPKPQAIEDSAGAASAIDIRSEDKSDDQNAEADTESSSQDNG